MCNYAHAALHSRIIFRAISILTIISQLDSAVSANSKIEKVANYPRILGHGDNFEPVVKIVKRAQYLIK